MDDIFFSDKEDHHRCKATTLSNLLFLYLQCYIFDMVNNDYITAH